MEKTRVILQNMDVNFGPSVAGDCWTSTARRGYYGLTLQFVTRLWDQVSLPLAVCRLESDIEETTVTKDGVAPPEITNAKKAEQLSKHAKETLDDFRINYQGCGGREACDHADMKHFDDEKHFTFNMTTDSGGADPAAGSKLACNATRCTPHNINTVHKDAYESIM